MKVFIYCLSLLCFISLQSCTFDTSRIKVNNKIVTISKMNNEKKYELQIKDYVFSVSIANNEKDRQKGLMGVPFLDPKEGMFFIHEEVKKVSYWMKNMKIPIDIIFIDKNFRIVDIYNSVSPCLGTDCTLYRSTKPIKYVLEIGAGETYKRDISIGDRIKVITPELNKLL